MKNILLVEDDPFLVDIYQTKLKECGFNVTVARDGQEGLNEILKRNFSASSNKEKNLWPDIIVLDIVLAKMNGWEVLREIKKDERLKNLKVLILSNLGQREEVDKGLKMGAVKYLIKAHYTPAEVVEEIKKILKED